MTRQPTFAKLLTPADLLRKAQSDLYRMADHMNDEYAAFDFFVTAEHLVDWYLPDNRTAQRKLRESEILLQITSHIANGAKHFIAKSKQHKSVIGIANQRSNYSETGNDGEVLFIEISPAEAEILGFQQIEAHKLALLVHAYWREKLGI